MFSGYLSLLIVLALALSLGATALAAGGDSTVQFKIDDTQISVDVPLNSAAVVKASDGTITWPTAWNGSAGYRLQNNSAFAVKVDSIQCSASSGWTLVAAATGTDDIVATVSPDAGTTTVNLLTTSQPCSGTVWNVGAGDSLALTLAGRIGTPGVKTQALSSSASTAFTITYTVSSGAHSA